MHRLLQPSSCAAWRLPHPGCLCLCKPSQQLHRVQASNMRCLQRCGSTSCHFAAEEASAQTHTNMPTGRQTAQTADTLGHATRQTVRLTDRPESPLLLRHAACHKDRHTEGHRQTCPQAATHSNLVSCKAHMSVTRWKPPAAADSWAVTSTPKPASNLAWLSVCKSLPDC